MFLAGRHITERKAISGLIAHGLAGGLLVACAAYRQDAMTRFLTRPFSLFLGRISYSFYLLNVVALHVCWAAIDAWVRLPTRHPLGWGLASGIVSVLLTIPVAALSERFIERPGVAAGRTLTKFPGMVRRALFARVQS